jgi:hypothetical protein
MLQMGENRLIKDVGLAFFVGVAIYELVTGNALTRFGSKIKRSEHPVYYWIMMTTSVFAGAFCVVLLVYDVFFRP